MRTRFSFDNYLGMILFALLGEGFWWVMMFVFFLAPHMPICGCPAETRPVTGWGCCGQLPVPWPVQVYPYPVHGSTGDESLCFSGRHHPGTNATNDDRRQPGLCPRAQSVPHARLPRSGGVRRLLAQLHGLVGRVIREESDSYGGRLLRANYGRLLSLLLLIGLIATGIANVKLVKSSPALDARSVPGRHFTPPVFNMFPDLHI